MKTLAIATLLVTMLLAGCAPSGAGTTATAAIQPEESTPSATEPLAQPSPIPSLTQAEPTEVQPTMVQPSSTPAAAAPALACSGVLTSPNMEGPYYTAGSPERASLVEPGMTGTPILITGQVFTQDCQPLAGAKVDFWQADDSGEYDNAGYRLRGHVITDTNGAYTIETIVPGLYTGRPPHIHVKVFSPDGSELLTTQLYFPGSEDSADVQGAPGLLVSLGEPDEQGRRLVLFNFIVP